MSHKDEIIYPELISQQLVQGKTTKPQAFWVWLSAVRGGGIHRLRFPTAITFSLENASCALFFN